jgi:hypothetical protein
MISRLLRHAILVHFYCLVLLVSPTTVTANPVNANTSLKARYSDNVTKSNENKKTDVEYTATLGVDKGERFGKFDTSVYGEFRYLYFQQKTYDGLLEGDIAFNGDYYFIPRQFIWNISDSINQVPVNTTASDTPGNRQRRNVFSTGPTWIVRLNNTNNARFNAGYVRTDFQTEGKDSDRYRLLSSLNHLFSDTANGSINNVLSKSILNNGVDLYRIENYGALNLSRSRSRLAVAVGYTTIKGKTSSQSEKTDSNSWDIKFDRDVGRDSKIALNYSRSLDDTSSDYNSDSNSSINFTETSVVRVTQWQLLYNKAFSQISALGLSLYQNESFYPVSNNTEQNIGMSANTGYPVSKLLSVDLKLAYENTKFDVSNREDDQYNLSFGLKHRALKDVSWGIGTGYEKQVSNSAANDYGEWWVSLNISYNPYFNY